MSMDTINIINNIHNNNTSRDGGTRSNINKHDQGKGNGNGNGNGNDDFDFIDYEVLPISNRKIDARSHESALRTQEEGRSFKPLPAFLATKRVLARSRRKAELARIRLDPDSKQHDDTSSNDDGKPLPLTPQAFHAHLRLEREKATRLARLRKDAALMATQEACNWMIQRREARRRLSLVSAAAAAAGRSRDREHQRRQRRQVVLPQPTSTATILSYEDVCEKTTAQLLGMLLELRDSSDHFMYAMVQGELGARAMETQVAAFHAFLQCEEDKASRAIAAAAAAEATVEGTNDDDVKLLQQGQGQAHDPGLQELEDQKNDCECYVADDESSFLSKSISDIDAWDPPLLPCLRKHVERLPIGTPTQFLEDLRVMNEIKTEQARRRHTIFRWIVAGMAFAALIATAKVAGFPFVSSVRPPTISDDLPPLEPTVTSQELRMLHHLTNEMPRNSSIEALALPLQLSQSQSRHSRLIYSKVELLLPPWAHRHPASMALSTINSPRALAIVPQQAARIIATENTDNVTVNASEEPLIHSKNLLIGSSSALTTFVSPRALAIYHKRARVIPPSMVNSTAGLFLHSAGTFWQPASPRVPLSSVVRPTDHRVQDTSTEQTSTLNRAQRSPPSTPLSATVISRALAIYHQRRARMIPPIMVNSTFGLLLQSELTFRHLAIALQTDLRFQATSTEQTSTLNRAQRSPSPAALPTVAGSRCVAYSAWRLVDRRIQKIQPSSELLIIVNQRDLIQVARAQPAFARVLGVAIHPLPPDLLPPPPDPPPGSLLFSIFVFLCGLAKIQGAGFWGYQGIGVLPVAYLVALPLPPPEPPPPFLHPCLSGTCVFEKCAVRY